MENWTKTEIGIIAAINKTTLTEKTSPDYEFFYVDIASVDEGKISFPKEKIKFANAPSRARRIVQKDDVLMSTVRPNLKSFAHFSFNRKDVIASTGFAVLRPTARIDSKFLFHSIFSDYISKQISLLLAGSNYPALNSSEVENLILYLPPLAEQKKIAEILSTWDKSIETTEKLIAAKQKLKKSLMQRLLTGSQRFPEFHWQEWEEVRLKDVFDRVTRKNAEVNTNVVTISAQRGFVRQSDYFNKNVASEILDNYFLVEKGEFCYNKSYSNGYPWGATKRLKDFDKAVVTTLYICFGIKNEKETSGDFFEQFFESNLMEQGLAKVAHEGGRAHGLLNVTPSDFFNLKITIPAIAEQKKIAAVLYACDAEINVLQSKLDALRQQKRGLMQKLLTGQVRVKVEEN